MSGPTAAVRWSLYFGARNSDARSVSRSGARLVTVVPRSRLPQCGSLSDCLACLVAGRTPVGPAVHMSAAYSGRHVNRRGGQSLGSTSLGRAIAARAALAPPRLRCLCRSAAKRGRPVLAPYRFPTTSWDSSCRPLPSHGLDTNGQPLRARSRCSWFACVSSLGVSYLDAAGGAIAYLASMREHTPGGMLRLAHSHL